MQNATYTTPSGRQFVGAVGADQHGSFFDLTGHVHEEATEGHESMPGHDMGLVGHYYVKPTTLPQDKPILLTMAARGFDPLNESFHATPVDAESAAALHIAACMAFVLTGDEAAA